MFGFCNKFFIQIDEKWMNTIRKKIIPILKKELNVEINISENTIEVVSIPNKTIPTNFLKAISIIRAVSLGFKPEIALKLLDDEFRLEIIELHEVSRKRENLKRIKARIIGEGGRVKRNIEEISSCYISISDNIVGIIGEIEKVLYAKEAIEKIVRGSTYRSVYNFLRRMISYY